MLTRPFSSCASQTDFLELLKTGDESTIPKRTLLSLWNYNLCTVQLWNVLFVMFLPACKIKRESIFPKGAMKEVWADCLVGCGEQAVALPSLQGACTKCPLGPLLLTFSLQHPPHYGTGRAKLCPIKKWQSLQDQALPFICTYWFINPSALYLSAISR